MVVKGRSADRSSAVHESNRIATLVGNRRQGVASNRQPHRYGTDGDGQLTVDRPTGGLGAGADPVVQRIRGTGVADRVAGASGVLVGLDFDGTLTPIAGDADAPTITPACRRALEPLVSHPRVAVAVISGRELADLKRRVGLRGIVYAGNHGLELCFGAHTVVHPAAAERRPEIRRAIEGISEALAGVPGVKIENKGLAATVHVRQTPARWIAKVRSAVEWSIREANGLRFTSGKQVFEIRPAVDWDKGAAIDRIAREVPDGWLTMYVGDDLTDEDAFRAILPDGIGVLVGSRDRTDAAYRLPTQTAVAPFLESLAGMLDGR